MSLSVNYLPTIGRKMRKHLPFLFLNKNVFGSDQIYGYNFVYRCRKSPILPAASVLLYRLPF